MSPDDSALGGRPVRLALPMRVLAPVPPGCTAIVTSRPRKAFRAERLVISPASFPLSWPRRAWTWPLVVVGGVLGRAHRALARLLRVDLYASHERREELGEDAEVPIDPDTDLPVDPEISYDYGEECYVRTTPIPLNRRERFTQPIGRLAQRLAGVRRHWQLEQLGSIIVHNIRVGSASQLAQPGGLPGDLFASAAIDTFVTMDRCATGGEITIEFENTNRRPCHFTAAWIGLGQAG